MKKDKISIIIPCYNEEECIKTFYEEADKVSKKMPDQEFELLYINDGSTDNSLDMMKELHKKDKRVRFISFSRNFGKEAGMYAGLEHATGDYVTMMDVDLQDPPEMLIEMYKAIKEEGYDCVALYTKTHKDYSLIRRFCTKMWYKLIDRISATKQVPGARDYRLMTRQMVNSLLKMNEYNRYIKGFFSYVGFNTKWIGYETPDRKEGVSKFPLSKLLDMYSNNSYQGSDEDFCKLIVNRINASSNLNNMEINMRLFRKAGYDLSDVNLEKQIVEALLARKNVSCYIEEISEATYRALQSKIYETVKDKDSYVNFIVGSGVSSRYVEEDSELICSLIEGGHSDLAVKSRIFERCVIENIDRLKEPISEFIRDNNDYYSSAREDLLSALSQIPSFNDYFYEFLNNNNGNITLNDNYFTNSKILDRLISENKAETFKNVLLKSDLSNAYSNVKIFEGTPDFQEYLINQLNTDSIFCDKFFGKQKYWILRSEYMTNY